MIRPSLKARSPALGHSRLREEQAEAQGVLMDTARSRLSLRSSLTKLLSRKGHQGADMSDQRLRVGALVSTPPHVHLRVLTSSILSGLEDMLISAGVHPSTELSYVSRSSSQDNFLICIIVFDFLTEDVKTPLPWAS